MHGYSMVDYRRPYRGLDHWQADEGQRLRRAHGYHRWHCGRYIGRFHYAGSWVLRPGRNDLYNHHRCAWRRDPDLPAKTHHGQKNNLDYLQLIATKRSPALPAGLFLSALIDSYI